MCACVVDCDIRGGGCFAFLYRCGHLVATDDELSVFLDLTWGWVAFSGLYSFRAKTGMGTSMYRDVTTQIWNKEPTIIISQSSIPFSRNCSRINNAAHGVATTSLLHASLISAPFLPDGGVKAT